MIMMIFGQLLHLIPQAIVVIGCFIYISKTQSLAGVIALIGSLGGIAVSIGQVGFITMINQGHFGSGYSLSFMWVIRIGYLITSLMFAAGFVGIALTAKRKQPPQTNQEYITTER